MSCRPDYGPAPSLYWRMRRSRAIAREWAGRGPDRAFSGIPNRTQRPPAGPQGLRAGGDGHGGQSETDRMICRSLDPYILDLAGPIPLTWARSSLLCGFDATSESIVRLFRIRN